MIRVAYSLLVFSILVALTLPASAHGGIYVVPGDAGSPSSAKDDPAASPTNPAGAAGVGPGAASGSAGFGPSTRSSRGGSGRLGGRGSGRRGARTGASEAQAGWNSWEFWWNANSAQYLSLRGRLEVSGASTGFIGLLTGKGLSLRGADGVRPDQRMVSELIAPALTSLTAERAGDIADSAVLALARVSDPAQAPGALDALLPQLAHAELSVRSSAALALGVLGDVRAEAALVELARDSSHGRQLVGGGHVSSLVRCFSALSLGMLGGDEGIGCLVGLTSDLGPSERELSVAACMGLSQIPSEHPRAGMIMDAAKARLADRYTDPLLKAHLVTLLAKLGGQPRVPELVDLLEDRDTDPIVRQSVALALGRVAAVTQPRAVERLQQLIESERDALTRQLAILALGRMGGRDQQPAEHGEAHAAIEAMLTRELAGKGKQSAQRSWAGLAAALYARGGGDAKHGAGTPRSDRLVARLAAAYERESDPAHRGAFAVALGLAGARSAGPQLAQDLRTQHDDGLRGHLAIALGLLGEREAEDDLMRLCSADRTAPTLRRKAATGLGLMGRRDAVPALVRVLTQAGTLGESAGAAAALGLMGDRDAVDPLVGRATDTSAGALSRGFAVAALGLLAERGRLPFHAALLADAHYLARTDALTELMDLL
ncbi:MAG: hypothetical protein DRQ55_04855 [Planctomycetota bacterium]|nr:MAG: hypothetical protein DRQ55_04855 [Planctomycetota bacterium]